MNYKDDRKFEGIWIPKEVWFDKELKLIKKLFLIEINSLDKTERGCFASNNYFGDFFQLSPTRCSIIISDLWELELINIKFNYNGKEILFVNHQGLSGDEMYNSIKEANDFILANKKEYPTVVDFTDSTGSKRVNEYLHSQEVKEASKYITKQAVVGITGIKRWRCAFTTFLPALM